MSSGLIYKVDWYDNLDASTYKIYSKPIALIIKA